MARRKTLKVGEMAPEFTVPDQNGNPVTLSSFRGKKVVLYFYPQDNTPTCTIEACNLRDNYKALIKAGYKVLGVSPDSSRKHINFIKKFNLPFDLLADEDLEVCKTYGVWGWKESFGRRYQGVKRTTYVIDESGVISEIIRKVVSKDHAAQILS